MRSLTGYFFVDSQINASYLPAASKKLLADQEKIRTYTDLFQLVTE